MWQSFETVPDSVSHLQEHNLGHLSWILVIEKEVRSHLEHHHTNAHNFHRQLSAH